MKKWLFALIMAFALNTVFASDDLEWAKKKLQPLISLSQDSDFQRYRRNFNFRPEDKVSFGEYVNKLAEASNRSIEAVKNDLKKLNKSEEKKVKMAILYNLLLSKTWIHDIFPTNVTEEYLVKMMTEPEKEKNENDDIITLLKYANGTPFEQMLFLGEMANNEQEKREIYNEVIRFFVNFDYLKYDEPIAQNIAITIMVQHRDLLAKPKMEKLCNYCKSNSNKCDAKKFGSFVFKETVLQRCQSGVAMKEINHGLYEH